MKKEEFKNFCTLTYKHLLYSIRCLKRPSDKFIKFKQVELDDLPRNYSSLITSIYISLADKKKTLILDLDETLIHTCEIDENPE